MASNLPWAEMIHLPYAPSHFSTMMSPVWLVYHAGGAPSRPTVAFTNKNVLVVEALQPA